jgi:hypothetical protein
MRNYWFSGVKFFESIPCRKRSLLKSGTIMENSKLPIQTGMLAFMFVSAIKKGFSCLEFQRQLGLSKYFGEKLFERLIIASVHP